MKNKSSHHRVLNTFRFQTFHERLASINIDVARKLGQFSATPEEADTFFAEALNKWTDLNYTQHYVDFRREISGEVQTLAQLVHHQNEIVQALHKHLKIENSLALPALLDLVVQLARDLQADFYPCFEEFFRTLVWLLNTYHHDVETLEKAFTCLAYLFKFLWRHMTKDVKKVFILFLPLLGADYKEYIHSFAAESFAFLMRKEKKHDELFEFMFESVEECPKTASGVGKLMFEMVKGIKQQFHSITEKVLPCLLTKLGNPRLAYEYVLEAVHAMFGSMAEHTTRDHCGVVWTVLLSAVASVEQHLGTAKLKQKPVFQQHLQGLLELVYRWICQKKGALITCPDQLIQVFCTLLTNSKLSEDCACLLQQSISELLLATKCTLEPQHRPKLVNTVFKSNLPRHLVFTFCRSLFDITLFEKDLLPGLLIYCQNTLQLPGETFPEILCILTQLLQHKIPPSTGVADTTALSVFPLDFTQILSRNSRSKQNATFPELLLKQLNDSMMMEHSHSVSIVWACLVCLPHIRPISEDKSLSVLSELLEHLQTAILTPNSSKIEQDKYLCLLRVTSASLLSIHSNKDEFFKQFTENKVVALLKASPCNADCLGLTDMYFTSAKRHCERVLSEEIFTEVFSVLQFNLSSPHGQVRALSLHILAQFDLQLPVLPENMSLDQTGVFRVCLDAEQTPVSMQSYREKMRHLRKLAYDVVQYQIPIGPFELVPLRYLLGALYVNFRLMWEPITELLASHARGLHKDTFWPLFEEFLNQAAQNTENKLRTKNPGEDDLNQSTTSVESVALDDLLTAHMECATRLDRPDHDNFRHQLWKAMCLVPEECEPRSKIVAPILFRFLENEFYPADMYLALTQDIQKHSLDAEDDADDLNQSQNSIDPDIDITQSDDLEDKSEVIDQSIDKSEERMDVETESKNIAPMAPSSVKSNAKKKIKRAPNKTLVVHLELFSKFKNPKSIHLEPKLRELYFKLLQYTDSDVQKVAYDCVMTYKHKYLTPYRENFERLLADKTFKNEIVLFGVDESSTVIETGHREGLLPVLLRILYGKMQYKTGKDTSGRAQSHIRKSIILRFMAGLKHDEIRMFLDMVFEPFKDYMTGSICEKTQDIMASANPGSVIPLKKLQGVLNTIDLVLDKLGSLIEGYFADILQLLVCVGALCVGLLQQRDKVNTFSLTLLKTIRNAVITRVNQFFRNFDFHVFSEEQMQSVFTVCVWPQLDKLPLEGIHNPTPLLKLLKTWSELHKYFVMLGRVHPTNPDLTPLPYVFQLLHMPKVKPAVVSMVMDMVETLLTTEDPDTQIMETDAVTEKDGISYGTRLLLPHVPTILNHLKTVAQKLEGVGGKKKAIPTRELNILSRLSEHVSDGAQSSEVIALLLPFLGRRLNRSQDVEVDILRAVTNLIKQIQQPESFTGSLSSLFSVLAGRQSRVALCDVLQAIAGKSEDTKTIADIVIKLNAWDSRRVDQPDYMVRLEGFEEANKFLQQSTEGSQLLMLIHNCCFFLASTDDMSLRDSSSFCLQKLIEKLAKDQDNTELYKLVIVQNLLPEIKDKLKHSSEVVRYEFINLLACLVRAFSDKPAFCHLALLLDREDPEVDFFNNITHIQQHRRARALRRISKYLTTTKYHSPTLVSYILPIATMYVKDPAYAKASNLHDAAVEAIGAICRQLPWPRYLIALKYFLMQLSKSLDNQKLAVRLVVAVLDAFHFDLKNSKGVKAHLVTDAKTDQPMPMDDTDSQEQTLGEDEMNTSQTDMKEAGKGEDSSSDDDTDPHSDLPVAPEAVQVCAEGLATRIHRLIVRTIVPQLHRSLTEKARSDDDHKKAKASKYAEDDEILRVPLALAMVKLLQNLPKGTLEQNLPSILLKVCMFLRSRAKDIRETARDTLTKILMSLGPSYLFYIVKELQIALRKGYQMHVMCYTVWSLLKSLTTTALNPGDLDGCIDNLVKIFNEELFGALSEEKEVDGITSKLFEAKSSKSYDSYGIMGKYVSRDSLPKMVNPLREVLDSTNSHKKARKVSDVLHKVSLGLVENAGLPLTDLLTFVYTVTNEHMPELTQMSEKANSGKQKAVSFRPLDTHLLKREPKRGGNKPKAHVRANVYILVDFGLQVLHLLLKKSSLTAKEKVHLELLDPFVSILTTCMPAKYIKVTTTTLRCLSWVLKFPLPALKDHIQAIASHLFVLLSNYASAGAAQGENFELMVMCFKVMTIVVRDVQYHTISTEQLQILLSYAEQDIHDFSRQATAFTLLKAILSRKLVVSEMQEVIGKVQQLSVVSETPHVRLQCRQVVMQYLMDYPLGSKLQRHLEFYVRQLEYEHESGRESALEMLAKIFSDFPQRLLTQYSGLFFLPLSMRLVNDESTRCKKLTTLAIKSLLNRLESEERDKLFGMCTTWLDDKRPSLCKLAALALGLIVEVESTSFERHLETVLPQLECRIQPENCPEEGETESETKDKDRFLFTMLSLLIKICRDCDILTKMDWTQLVFKIFCHLESHLLHPHTWVRLASAQLYGMLFGSWTPQGLVSIATECAQNNSVTDSKRKKKKKHKELIRIDSPRRYLVDDFQEKLHLLCGVFCKQLASPQLEQELSEQVVKNLIFLAKILQLLPDNEPDSMSKQPTEEPHNSDTTKRASLTWLVKRMCREAKMEAALNPKQTIKRSSVFKWTAAVSLDLGPDKVLPHLPTLLLPLIREITDHSANADESLKQLSQEVIDLLKTMIGVEKFTRVYASIQTALTDKRQGRKRQRMQEAVSNPELNAKRKIKKNLAKKEAKKRKMEDMRPTKKIKKSKIADTGSDFS